MAHLRSLLIALVAAVVTFAQTALADDRDDAAAAANEVLAALNQQQYEWVWDQMASAFLKRKTDKDSFISSVATGRANLGKLRESKVTDVVPSESDASSGYHGQIYAVEFANTYASGEYLERLVVVKEDDGHFRLSGLWGKAAQSE